MNGMNNQETGKRGGSTLPPHVHRAIPVRGEWEMVQEILYAAPSPIAREFLLHYYISAKSWPLVLLIGRPGVGKRRLFHLLAEGIAGCSDGRIRLLPAQFSWQEHAQSRYIDSIQSRFNTMAFVDLLAEATAPGNEGQAYFLCLDQATPEELGTYMDLYLTGDSEDDGPPPLSPNLYLTAILSTTGGTWCLPPALLDRVGVVEVTVALGETTPGPPHCPPVGWQRLFSRSTVRDPARARGRLRRLGLLEAFRYFLESLPAGLGSEMGPNLEEGLLLCAANGFTTEGVGLLDGTAMDNLRQVVDLHLAQRLLPCLAQRPSWGEDRWSRLVEGVEGVFPQAHARARRILIERSVSAEGSMEAACQPASMESSPSSERKDR